MDNIDQATKLFHEGKYKESEQLALETYMSGERQYEAADILAAIFLRENKLYFLDNVSDSHFLLIAEIADILRNLKMFEQTVFFQKILVEISPKDPGAHSNLGLAYMEVGENEKAEQSFLKSLKIKESYPALYNLGVVYRQQKKLNKSKVCLQKAYDIEPNNPYANYSLGMTYLMEKNFEKGYQYFMKRPINNLGTDTLKNFWDGGSYPDKTILVYCEYGFGDAIMFSRYFPILKQHFKTVKVYCNSALRNLFIKNFSDIEFVENVFTPYDYCAYSMDLPYLLNLDFEHIPSSSGYLNADKTKGEEFKKKFFDTDKKKIGIFYVGGELEKVNARHRAIPLINLSKLFSIEGTKFYSIQKDDIFDELKNFPQITDLGKELKDFSDTAAIIKNLDLLITVDSSPAHLAGALGVKTFMMLPYFSEWRWFLDEKSTPWYDSVELFRQQSPDNWQSVVKNIYEKI